MVRGRPREEGIDDAVREAVRALLIETGYRCCTIDAVAARAGVGKAAVYRRWRSKAELVFAAVIHPIELEPPPDTGSLRGDVGAVLEVIQSSLDGTELRRALPSLLADIRADPVLETRFGEVFLGRERGYLVQLLDRAVARGELPRRPDPVLVHALLLGPVLTWLHLFTELPPSGGLAASLASPLHAAVVALGA
ncbi:TetR/AcrR family transcriptional regulator [Amycolatopsis sp. QT-25]|uniref:TetR/AcrR family transcriptional regulator n=1 Tax=Amycolatopsis sp. QT-25 TaxID=3034022 RepID=UPI0023ECCE7F|nr:TetR/AcrR family transcriptional regulator [Amycolatopsis sp. QT-25]WET78525.1 TetR/AcrR family transcriptional regulator [Amycolatopsis sp. QT-25]